MSKVYTIQNYWDDPNDANSLISFKSKDKAKECIQDLTDLNALFVKIINKYPKFDPELKLNLSAQFQILETNLVE